MRISISLFLCFLISFTGIPQVMRAGQEQLKQPSSQSTVAALAFGLEDGTPVKLRLTRTISSADAKVEDRVDFEVLDDVKVADVVVIPRAGIAWATVTEAQSKRRMGRGGKLNVNIDSVRLVSGEKVALRAVKETQGGGHVGAMTSAIVATSILFFPAAPLFLFMHGKDITIPKGTEITAYISGNIPLDSQKFTAKRLSDLQPTHVVVSNLIPEAVQRPSIPQTTPAVSQIQTQETVSSPSDSAAAQPQTGNQALSLPVVSNDHATVSIKSTPEGADINVDGKYVGNTPSTLRLTPGDHTVSVEKPGFKSWQRTLTLSSRGIVTVDATLNKLPMRIE